MMQQEDSDLFWEEMAGVKPLKVNDSHFNQSTHLPTDSQLARRAAAAQNEYLDKLTVDPALILPVEPEEIISYKINGVQEEVFRHLRLGKYKTKSVIDLHAYRLVQARELLIDAVLQAYGRGERNILVIHGKGFKSKPFAGLMKSAVNHWLVQLEEVQAFHSATREQGGTGALFVMLVKSEQQRVVASETNRKGSGFR
ncbi:DNA endonuclease SmrA [Shewanella sp. 1_MG-2023]|uniref:DNA endonuclease SmrA n=2 Tax=Shewanella TaxID=22 RepID=A0ABT0KSY8_9GAMM|nr:MULTISPECIES: DNA endonuclease SmrA [Shewanella]MCL1046779.1 DNA endonuclease SmrA [Shewanella electrodiphila]MDO6772550.1 DNA endonuclease SmrA [Shewanella sp. 2_MG-2023]MDO6795246.1 DNA endonuclease SmrA [Shewanella sp. 1_MG-2023]